MSHTLYILVFGCEVRLIIHDKLHGYIEILSHKESGSKF